MKLMKPGEIMAVYGLTRNEWKTAARSMDLERVFVYPGAKPKYRREQVEQKFGKPKSEADGREKAQNAQKVVKV